MKDAAVSFFHDVVAAADRMRSEVDAAGIPDVPDGAETAHQVSTALRDVRDTLSDAAARVEGLSTEDPEAFASEMRTISGDVEASLDDVGNSLGSFEAPELEEAAEDVPACEELAA